MESTCWFRCCEIGPSASGGAGGTPSTPCVEYVEQKPRIPRIGNGNAAVGDLFGAAALRRQRVYFPSPVCRALHPPNCGAMRNAARCAWCWTADLGLWTISTWVFKQRTLGQSIGLPEKLVNPIMHWRTCEIWWSIWCQSDSCNGHPSSSVGSVSMFTLRIPPRWRRFGPSRDSWKGTPAWWFTWILMSLFAQTVYTQVWSHFCCYTTPLRKLGIVQAHQVDEVAPVAPVIFLCEIPIQAQSVSTLVSWRCGIPVPHNCCWNFGDKRLIGVLFGIKVPWPSLCWNWWEWRCKIGVKLATDRSACISCFQENLEKCRTMRIVIAARRSARHDWPLSSAPEPSGEFCGSWRTWRKLRPQRRLLGPWFLIGRMRLVRSDINEIMQPLIIHWAGVSNQDMRLHFVNEYLKRRFNTTFSKGTCSRLTPQLTPQTPPRFFSHGRLVRCCRNLQKEQQRLALVDFRQMCYWGCCEWRPIKAADCHRLMAPSRKRWTWLSTFLNVYVSDSEIQHDLEMIWRLLNYMLLNCY